MIFAKILKCGIMLFLFGLRFVCQIFPKHLANKTTKKATKAIKIYNKSILRIQMQTRFISILSAQILRILLTFMALSCLVVFVACDDKPKKNATKTHPKDYGITGFSSPQAQRMIEKYIQPYCEQECTLLYEGELENRNKIWVFKNHLDSIKIFEHEAGREAILYRGEIDRILSKPKFEIEEDTVIITVPRNTSAGFMQTKAVLEKGEMHLFTKGFNSPDIYHNADWQPDFDPQKAQIEVLSLSVQQYKRKGTGHACPAESSELKTKEDVKRFFELAKPIASSGIDLVESYAGVGCVEYSGKLEAYGKMWQYTIAYGFGIWARDFEEGRAFVCEDEKCPLQAVSNAIQK